MSIFCTYLQPRVAFLGSNDGVEGQICLSVHFSGLALVALWKFFRKSQEPLVKTISSSLSSALHRLPIWMQFIWTFCLR